MKAPTQRRVPRAVPHVLVTTITAALLAGCGGGADAPTPPADGAVGSAAAPRGEAVAAARRSSPGSLAGAVRAGAATTQEAIDSALAAHAAARAHDNDR